MDRKSSDFAKERQRMVEGQLRRRGIRDKSVLQAFQSVPRHFFVPPEREAEAYRDSPVPIGQGQTISQPFMVASMTEAARVKKGDRVLEVGCGCGYQLAILVEMGAEAFGIERVEPLAETARLNLDRLDYDAEIRLGDGTLGWPEAAPFDAIIVSAGAPGVPQPLKDQLAPGGRLVVPVEEGFSQVLYVVERVSAEKFREERRERCSFVPLIGEHGWGE